MSRSRIEPTRVDSCVVGRYTQQEPAFVRFVEFTAESLVFDNQWVELRNPVLSVTFNDQQPNPSSVEQITGWLRVPIRTIDQLRYDLCVDA